MGALLALVGGRRFFDAGGYLAETRRDLPLAHRKGEVKSRVSF